MADDYVKLLKQQRELEKKEEALKKQLELEKKGGTFLEGVEEFQRTLSSFGFNFKLLDYVANIKTKGNFVAKLITKDKEATLEDALEKLRDPETIKNIKAKLGLDDPKRVEKNPILGFINTMFDNLVGPEGDPNKPNLKQELKQISEQKAELAEKIKSTEKDQAVEEKIRKAQAAAKKAAAGAKSDIAGGSEVPPGESKPIITTQNQEPVERNPNGTVKKEGAVLE